MILPAHPAVRIASVASAFPAFEVGNDLATWGLGRLFPEEEPEFVRGLVERSGVETRRLALDAEQFFAPEDFTARNARYREAAGELAAEACVRALARADLEGEAIDVLIDVSCTGIAIPALDVDLSPRLGLRPDARRIPITESGCAGGALALGLAAQLAAGGQRVLVVAVELASLSALKGDRSRTNLIASVLFGDGAAAAVVQPGGRGPAIQAVGSHLFPDSRGAMGFDVGSHGLRIVLQRELPLILQKELRPAVLAFLEQHGRAEQNLGLHLIHPGGRRILEAYTELFGLDEAGLRFSREALRRYGNLSSASILTVLELALSEDARPPDGQQGLLLAFGPGLSAEMALLDWNGDA